MEYLFHTIVITALFGTLASSLNLLAGYTGMLALAHGAFFGIGAYTAALLLTHSWVSFLVVLPIAAIVAAIFSSTLSLPAIRIRDDYFAVASFAIQMVFFGLFNNWDEITGGALGISGIPRPTVFGWRMNTHVDFVIVSCCLLALSVALISRISRSPFGRVLRGIREDEVMTQSLGKNVAGFKVTACAVSAALAGCAGAVYAPYATFIDPTGFTINESILVLSMVILGGSGTVSGPVLGATVLVALPEILRFVGLPSATAANLRQVIYGSVLMLMVLFKPGGIVRGQTMQ
jgi:branched-chain amino acid transport system permease protein